MHLEITQKAQDEIIKAIEESDAYLRLSVEPGGCAGMSYAMVLDDNLLDGDRVIYEKDKLRVITDTDSEQHLDGLKIDFSDDLVESGFRLSNPNAQKSCGCGSSFGC